MTAIALVIASADYTRLNPLTCCRTDADAMSALLTATGRFDVIHRIEDRDANALKEELRSAIETMPNGSEIFFYFSGHGHSDDGEFFYCAKDFDPKRPHATGLSNAELHALLREKSPELVVKVVDACSSGALLFKSGGNFLPSDKGGLKNLVQIASCMDSQTSLAGEPLSGFTEQFCVAATSKGDGAVYYTDIVSNIRDEYLSDRDRSPHFVFQCSARETFTDDARGLLDFKTKLHAEWISADSADIVPTDDVVSGEIVPVPPTLLEMLRGTDKDLAKPEEVADTINALFDGLRTRLEGVAFSDYFDASTGESSSYDDTDSRAFMIRILTQQKRSDNFVTASITKERKKKNRFSNVYEIAMGIYDDDQVIEHWDLNLNMNLKRAQLVFTLIPKFMSLQKIKLVVTCAPSLEHCYVFEVATRHPRTDFQSFSYEGIDVTRRWYTQNWSSSVDWLIDRIADKLNETIESQLASARANLSGS